MNYETFLHEKRTLSVPSGFDAIENSLPSGLFDFQQAITKWSLRRGKSAIFADCGLGKTAMQVAWADAVVRETGKPVLILAPLAVSTQTVAEAAKFGVHMVSFFSDEDVNSETGNVTNYEKLHRFNTDVFGGVVLDESSILKSFDGKYRNLLIDTFINTPYKLACTATPAPNDYMEIGNHAEFLGIMSRTEMLAMFFTHDGGDTAKWRLKGHAEPKFWEWMASWSVMIRRPSDIGYSDERFTLPSLKSISHVVDRPIESGWAAGTLFPVEAQMLSDRQKERRLSIDERVAECAALVAAEPTEPWVIWCSLNDEGDALESAIPGAVQVAGSDKPEYKEWAMGAFSRGEIKVLISKVSICGYGMNWQHCARVAFVGLSDSWEDYYQAIRRCWRFGQDREVHCHIITADTEGAVARNIERKETAAAAMAENMVTHMKLAMTKNIHSAETETMTYAREEACGPGWHLYLGDCVDVTRKLETESVGYTVFSPPFASLYTYSNSERDMGNCKSDEEFYTHFRFLVSEMLRVTKPGRLLSFHCMNLPLSKERDGVIGIRDFRGEMIRLFTEAGWIYHSEVCIWKDPVTAMQRTKALGLLHKTIRKDSAMSRQGIPDYLVTMRKPGVNPDPISHSKEEFPVDLWQRYASPVWFDINPSRTLQKSAAREEEDERHICPLQLDVIERAINLWSAAGDMVFSPFAGIGSEGHVAIKLGRQFVGSELKRSYFDVAEKNLRAASDEGQSISLLDFMRDQDGGID